MQFQDLQNIVTEYNHSEKSWWQSLFGPPNFIKQLQLFLASFPDNSPERLLTDQENFQAYQILSGWADKRTRKTFADLYEYELTGLLSRALPDHNFEKFLQDIEDGSERMAATLLYKNFPIKILESSKIPITPELFQMLRQHPVEKTLAHRKSIQLLAKNHILTEANLSLLIQHPNSDQFFRGLEILEGKNLLTQTHFNFIYGQEDPFYTALIEIPLSQGALKHCLAEYDKNKGFFQRYLFPFDPPEIAAFRQMVESFNQDDQSLTEEEFLKFSKIFFSDLSSNNQVSSLTKYSSILRLLKLDLTLNEYTQYLKGFRGHPAFNFITLDTIKEFQADPTKQASLLKLLNLSKNLKINFISSEVFDSLVKLDTKTLAVIRALIRRMAKDNLLNPQNLQMIVRSLESPSGQFIFLGLGIILISPQILFNQEIFDAIAHYPNPQYLFNTLIQFYYSTMLISPTQVESAIKYAHILGHPRVADTLKRNFMDNHGRLFGCEELIRQAVHLCETHQGPEKDLLNRLARLFGNNFNHAQNTHTKSVHSTASTSALKLGHYYGNRINSPENLNHILAEIEAWLITTCGIKGKAAQRAFIRVQLPEQYIDSASQLSNLQLLALFWIAIHDETKRDPNVTLAEAKQQLLEALYEIQRGNNLVLNSNHALVDNQGEDDFICESGTFNKFIEKLYTLHPDIDMQNITHTGAMAKFPIVVQTVAMEYVRKLYKTMEPTAFRAMVENLQKDTGIDTIWPEIKQEVHIRMMDEFGILYKINNYPTGINHPKYLQILSALHDVELGKLLDYSKALLAAERPSMQGSFWIQEKPEDTTPTTPAAPPPSPRSPATAPK